MQQAAPRHTGAALPNTPPATAQAGAISPRCTSLNRVTISALSLLYICMGDWLAIPDPMKKMATNASRQVHVCPQMWTLHYVLGLIP